MKGVIVQVGEPKSIVLFNNGKIRAIPTPADCHVGMVVSVRINDNVKIIAISLAAVFLVVLGVFIGTTLHKDRAFPLPPSSEVPGYAEGHGRMMMMMRRDRQIVSATVEQAKNLPDDTQVLLTGNIVEDLGDEKYIFRDRTGEITVEIDRKITRDLSVGASDTVEISGEVDIERKKMKIDVKTVRKL